MPSSCAAYNCVVRFTKGLDVKFHRFPKNEIMRRKWVAAIRRKNYKPSATAVICSNHFREEDYYINPYKTKVLKKDAIPSVFDFPDLLIKTENSRTLNKNATEDIPPTSPVLMFPNTSALTPAEGSGNMYVEEQEIIPSTSQASQIPLDEEELVPSTSDPDVIGHESTLPKSGRNIRKRPMVTPVYLGDFEESDLDCPTKRHKYWNISQSVLQKYRKINKYLNCKLRRSNKKITDLNSLLDDPRERHQISSETSIILKDSEKDENVELEAVASASTPYKDKPTPKKRKAGVLAKAYQVLSAPDDESMIYCKHMAAKLRKVSDSKVRLHCEYLIDTLLYKAQMGEVTAETRIFTPDKFNDSVNNEPDLTIVLT